jgi:hypothetical protein
LGYPRGTLPCAHSWLCILPRAHTELGWRRLPRVSFYLHGHAPRRGNVTIASRACPCTHSHQRDRLREIARYLAYTSLKGTPPARRDECSARLIQMLYRRHANGKALAITPLAKVMHMRQRQASSLRMARKPADPPRVLPVLAPPRQLPTPTPLSARAPPHSARAAVPSFGARGAGAGLSRGEWEAMEDRMRAQEEMLHEVLYKLDNLAIELTPNVAMDNERTSQQRECRASAHASAPVLGVRTAKAFRRLSWPRASPAPRPGEVPAAVPPAPGALAGGGRLERAGTPSTTTRAWCDLAS